MVTETDLELGDGRTLHAYDTGAHDADGRLAVFWHHGSPNIGAPPEPLFSAADRLGIRSASTGSRSWVIPAAVRTPSRAPHCFLNASWVWSSWPGWPHSTPRGSNGSKDSGQLAWLSCAQRQPGALR